MDVELTEAWLSEETGISREVLRSAREKNLGAADWQRGSRGQIVWLWSALNRCKGEFPEFTALIEKFKGAANAPAEAVPSLETVWLVVTRKFANPQLIEAEDEEGGLWRVRVRDSANFAKGMRVHARPAKNKSEPWVSVGRAPRWPGRY